MTRKTLGIVMLAALGLLMAYRGSAAPITADQEDAVDQGRLLYRIYCQNCHGESGRGDGPTAEMMKVKPADLTRISRRNGGEFPADRVARTIDGRELVRGHGNRRMPIWGLSFQELDQDTNQENEVREKIRKLTQYLESIQEDVAR